MSEAPIVQGLPDLSKPLSFGLCDLPQNAEAFASRPVPVLEGACHYTQHFEATSPGPSSGGSCGGFTVAFGPQGALKTKWHRRTMRAGWADEPLTQAQCANARVSAVAWGARCPTQECATATWEKLGKPQTKVGYWQSVSKVCNFDLVFVGKLDAFYKTLNVDVIASLAEGGQTTRKRAFASIHAQTPNGKCPSATVTPR